MGICSIKNYKEKPDQFPELHFLKSALKLIKKAKKERVSTSKKKKNPPICGWCGKNHPSYLCKSPKDKWSNHFCTNCGGQGHPKAVCESKLTDDDEEDDTP